MLLMVLPHRLDQVILVCVASLLISSFSPCRSEIVIVLIPYKFYLANKFCLKLSISCDCNFMHVLASAEVFISDNDLYVNLFIIYFSDTVIFFMFGSTLEL